MLTLGIIITIITGFLIIKSYDTKNELHLAEVIGLTFPIGLLIEVSIMLLLDYLNLPLTTTLILSGNLLIILALLFFLKKRGVDLSFNIDWSVVKSSILSKNLVWVALLIIIVYLEYLNFAKCLYFPTFDNDSLVAFDTIGYLFAQEHSISDISFFDGNYNFEAKGAGSYIAYTPLTQVAYAFVYLFGASTSKLIPALLFASFLFALYGVLQREIKATGAMLITLLVLLTPEMISFSSMSGVNVIHAIYASIGMIYAIKWILRGNNERDVNFWGSALLLSANLMTRSEGIIFIGASGLFMLLIVIRTKGWKNFIIWCAITLTPFILWEIHRSVSGMTTDNFIIKKLFYDAEKFNSIASGFKFLFTTEEYYGWTFTALLISCIITLFFIRKDKMVWIKWSMFVIVVVGYALALYQVDYLWDSIQNVLNYSAKRFLFSFVPLAWYIAATNYPIAKTFEIIDNRLSFNRNKIV